MTWVGIGLVAVAPGIFWLWFYVRKDIYHPIPRRMLALAFGLGCLSTIPAGLVEYFLLGGEFDGAILEGDAGFAQTATAMLFVVGPVEEVCKFGAAWIKPYRSLYFEEPMDALVYAAAAGLGFASLENIGYVIAYGPEVMLIRAPISTLGHLAVSCVWGYAYGLHQQSGYRRHAAVGGSLVLAALLHGLFNTLALTSVLGVLAFSMVGLGGVWAYRRFQWGQSVSPFRLRRNYPTAACSTCSRQIRITSKFCPFCGASAFLRGVSLTCGQCRSVNRPDATYCTSCGDRLLTS